MAGEATDPIERWTAKRRVALVVSILKGETAAAEAARQHGLTVAEVEEWREKFLVGAENALRSRPKDEAAVKDEQLKKLKQKIGDLVLDNDLLREALNHMRKGRKCGVKMNLEARSWKTLQQYLQRGPCSMPGPQAFTQRRRLCSLIKPP